MNSKKIFKSAILLLTATLIITSMYACCSKKCKKGFKIISVGHLYTFQKFPDLQELFVSHMNERHGDMDLLVSLGDNTIHGTEPELKNLFTMLDKIKAPKYFSPGNHDMRSKNAYRNWMKFIGYTSKKVTVDDMNFLFLNTVNQNDLDFNDVEMVKGGGLDEASMNLLRALKNRPLMITPANWDDVNWENGVSKVKAGFFVDEKEDVDISSVEVGDSLLFNDSGERVVTLIKENQIWTDGELLDPLLDGYPNKIKLIKKNPQAEEADPAEDEGTTNIIFMHHSLYSIGLIHPNDEWNYELTRIYENEKKWREQVQPLIKGKVDAVFPGDLANTAISKIIIDDIPYIGNSLGCGYNPAPTTDRRPLSYTVIEIVDGKVNVEIQYLPIPIDSAWFKFDRDYRYDVFKDKYDDNYDRKKYTYP
ncbi:metallophosphoesterase family protein [Thermodesulfobacteriota bacterium]